MPLVGSRPDRKEVLFRALCATGLAVYRNLEDLRGATQEPGIQDWLTLLRTLDRLAIAEYERQASARDAGHELEWARGQTRALAQTLRGNPAAKEVAEVLDRIAEGISPASDDELLAQLEAVHQRGRQLAGRVVAEYGTTDVHARWEGCPTFRMELAAVDDLPGMRTVNRAEYLCLGGRG